jgi:hypothetical protein
VPVGGFDLNIFLDNGVLGIGVHGLGINERKNPVLRQANYVMLITLIGGTEAADFYKLLQNSGHKDMYMNLFNKFAFSFGIFDCLLFVINNNNANL